ncbi:MAG: SMP-30/gluconolactonase/LRE family protein [Armatimonadota bacterium]
MKPFKIVAVATIVAASATAAVVAQQNAVRQAAEDVRTAAVRTRAGIKPNQNLLFNGWGLTPAGKPVSLEGDMPLRMVVSPDKRFLATVTCGYQGVGLSLLDIASQKVTQFVPLKNAWNGLCWTKDGKRLLVSGGSAGVLHVFDYADGKVTLKESLAVEPAPAPPAGKNRRQRRQAAKAAAAVGLPTFISGIAVHPVTGKVYVCNEGAHEVWVLNAATLQREEVIPVGSHPHSCAVGGDGNYLYVSNWGGRTVSVVDLLTNERVRDIPVGVRPNDMALAPDGRLFVACSGDNTIHVVTTGKLETVEAEADPNRRPPESAREIIATSLYASSPEGSTPAGVAVSSDGKTLFVANADNNSVLVADITEPATTVVSGFIPVGWYPTAVAVSPDSNTLIVANGKGLRSLPSNPPSLPAPRRLHNGVLFNHPGQLLEGSVSFIARPTQTELVRYTEQVRKNSPYTPETLRQSPIARGSSVVPERVGAPCPIEHVLYIIKENRTYDQVYGDMTNAAGKPIGNGEPKLVLYGEDITPNQHQLARDYVLLDNLYCNSEVSVDGHSWSDAAMATDWNQRSWTMSYSKHGTLPGNAEMSTPTAGYLWDLCKRNGISFKCYGEGAKFVPTANRGTWSGGRDMNRVSGWISDLQAAEKTGNLPRFMIMSLGENHTKGKTPGEFTPEAAVASNDIGVGKIVAAASRSKFWPKMAIFIIEDDAQNGPDHVDAHRTAGLVISPYTRQGIVDSTQYTTASMIRTMELILGMPPLTQYDAGATPMFRSFGATPKAVPFALKTPKVDVLAKNAATGPGAEASARMNWEKYDDFDEDGEDTLNRILWAAAKGPNVPYPAPIHRVLFSR